MKVKKELKKAIPGLIENRYFDYYCNLIERAMRTRDLDEVELHHYVPNSLVPNTNVVALTPREHFHAHLLLTKFLTGLPLEKMLYAINLMLNLNKYPAASSIYASLKSKFYEIKHRKIYVLKYTYPDGGVAIDFSRTNKKGTVIAEFDSINQMLNANPITAYHPDDPFTVYHPVRGITDEAKRSISLKNSINQRGEGNSQYGTIWIHSLTEKRSKKIRSTDEIPVGWIRGRKIKFDEE